MTHLEDQLKAAQAETRKSIRKTLGLPESYRPKKGTTPFVEYLLDAALGASRCNHLEKRPIQPWFLALPWMDWKCRPCMSKWSLQKQQELQNGYTLGPIEEFTCDRCRLFTGKQLTPIVIAQDIWMITGSLCDKCIYLAKSQGASIAGGDA